MNRSIIYLAMLALTAQLAFGISLASSCPGCNQLNFYTEVDAEGGIVTVTQSGEKDVSFTNDLEVTNGGLDFSQVVRSSQWKFTNVAYLEGAYVSLRGVTLGTVECEPNCGCAGRIAFRQDIDVVGYPDRVLPPPTPTYYDPWAYQRLEQLCDGTVLEQQVMLEPIADWSDRIDQGESMHITQSGLGCGLCGNGFLAQSGTLYGDHVSAWQRGFVDGNQGYSEIDQRNTPNWLSFNQIMSFNN